MIVGDSDALNAMTVDEPLGVDGLGFNFRRFRRRAMKRARRSMGYGRRGKSKARHDFLRRFKSAHPRAWRATAAYVQRLRKMRGARRFHGLAGLSGPVEDLENELELGGLWDDIKGGIKKAAAKFIKSEADQFAIKQGVKQADKGKPPSALPQVITLPGGHGIDTKTLAMIGGGGLLAIMLMMQMKKKG